jgi:hypothetical protein
MTAMLKGLRSYVHKYMLQKELRFHKPYREITNITDAKEVGILMDATDTDRTTLINQLADSLHTQFRKVHILGFYNFPKAALNLNFPHFHNKELNWYLEPQGHLVDEFIERKFDVLINAYCGENLPLEYVSALSNAKYRIGIYDPQKTYLSDVFIDTKDPSDLKAFVEQVKHYIYQIR